VTTVATQARIWLKANAHRDEHQDAYVTVAFARKLCAAAVAVDEIDQITARLVDRDALRAERPTELPPSSGGGL
jgi:hypothetical protein